MEQTSRSQRGQRDQGASPPAADAQERTERKQRILTHGTPSVTAGIPDAVVIKDGNLYFLCDPDGSVPCEPGHGLGLYYNDCRYLGGYELKLGGVRPNPLVSTAERGFEAIVQLTNPDLGSGDAPAPLVPKETLGLKWTRVVDSERLALEETLTLQSYGHGSCDLPLEMTLRASFEDVFAIRGLLDEHHGEAREPEWKDGALRFVYDGADDIERRLTVCFDPAPDETEGTTARFHLHFDPGERREIRVTLAIGEGKTEGGAERDGTHPDPKGLSGSHQRRSDEWLSSRTSVRSGEDLLLDRVLERSLRDLRVLRSRLDGKKYFAAGVPWFVTLFGRDSVITALQTLLFDPSIAEETLRLLAEHQGTKVDPWHDEEPGKILHSLRVGEMAHLGEIPHTPYYGSVDATPLFLVLVARHAAWTGSLAPFRELRGAVDAALRWMDDYGALRDGGYIAYRSSTGKGLINQGWKDSGDAIVDENGKIARPPIAMVELQGYAYMAKIEIAELFRRDGDAGRADRLVREAAELRERFERDFWLEDKGVYALALQKDGEPAAVVSSNPGHALWAGIADPGRARRTADALLGDGMWSGWGVRTLSSAERAYNPIGYHLGTVWPHDNSIVAAGFRRYGFDEGALRIFDGLIQAALHFPHLQLPELFSGFGRDEYEVPVRYPVACHPQAWAAGSIPFLVQTLLGIVPEAFEKRLRIVRPLLPGFVEKMEVKRLQVGEAKVDLWFERTSRGVAVEVVGLDGDLQVLVEPGRSS
jgi:glycogen debranching enzyme